MPVFNSFRTLVFLTLAIAVLLTYRNIKLDEKRHAHARRNTGGPLQCKTSGQISITFDYGVSTVNTPKVLDVLKEKQVIGTFHLSQGGLNDQLTLTILKRMIAEKHIIGIFYKGPPVQSLTESALRESLYAQTKLIYSAIGLYPRFIRFPYNTANASTYEIVTKLGFVPSMYSIDTREYNNCNNGVALETSMLKEVTTVLAPFKAAGNLKGSFISLHVDQCEISGALKKIIDAMTVEYGYSLVPLDSCTGVTDRYFSKDPGDGQSTTTPTFLPSSTSSPATSTSTTSTATSSSTSSTSSSSTPTSTSKSNSGAPRTLPVSAVLLLIFALVQVLSQV